MPTWIGRKNFPVILGCFLVVAAGFVLFLFNPADTVLFPPCPFHWATGLYCPGCGASRAVHLLLHGRLIAAFNMNPLLVLSLPFLAALLLRPRWAYLTWVPWFAAAMLVAFGILRNLPVWPFDLMAPH